MTSPLSAGVSSPKEERDRLGVWRAVEDICSFCQDWFYRYLSIKCSKRKALLDKRHEQLLHDIATEDKVIRSGFNAGPPVRLPAEVLEDLGVRNVT